MYYADEWYVPSLDFWAKREANNTKVIPTVKSNIAVVSQWKIEGKGAHKIMCMGDEAEIDILMTDINGFFSWKESAEIDGVTHSVNSSIHEVSATEQEIYLNYPQGDEIIHDPKIGFENLLLSRSLPTGNPLVSENLPIIAVVSR